VDKILAISDGYKEGVPPAKTLGKTMKIKGKKRWVYLIVLLYDG
jgi:hypothetical protein